MINAIFDMESNDPDDYLTLLLLLGHPKVNLKAVTITPGSIYQIGLVERTLKLFEKEIPIGSFDITHPSTCVSSWHERVYGKIEPSQNAENGAKVLYENCDENTTLITGAPLKNLGKALDYEDFKLKRLVAQGGFAGEGVIPREKQMKKFEGKLTCPTFNLNGDRVSAKKVLETDKIEERYFVSKNVCHSVVYDSTIHEILRPIKDKSLSLKMIYKGMNAYLEKKASGKKFHDPLAACCAIDLEIGVWAEVEKFYKRGGWGSKLAENTNTWIITDYDKSRFLEVLMAF